MKVCIEPLPTWARKTKFRPQPAPVFPAGEPSADDLELALALFAELDAESQAWYGGVSFQERLRDQLMATGRDAKN